MSSVWILHNCFSCILFCCWDGGGMHVYMFPCCAHVQAPVEARGQHLVPPSIALHFIFRDRVSPWTWSSLTSKPQRYFRLHFNNSRFVPITASLCGCWDSHSSSPWLNHGHCIDSHLQLSLVLRRFIHFTQRVLTVGLRPGCVAQW